MKEHLSTIANGLFQLCAEILDTSKKDLIKEFEMSSYLPIYNYSRGLVEFFCYKAVERLCCDYDLKFDDGNFSRFTFYMMLAWEIPSKADEQLFPGSVGKEYRKEVLQGNAGQLHDDIPLLCTEIMSLSMDGEKHVGKNAFVWLGSILPLAADGISALFVFSTLTATTAGRLHYPTYDRFLKEITKCMKFLQKQSVPMGFELAKDEFILHVDGNGMSQGAVRHMGSTSLPGKLTLTNRALYFEASESTSYDNRLKIDLSSVDHKVMPSSAVPFGDPLLDKAITFESSQLTSPVILDFPEMEGSTRRDYWFALIKEVMLMHRSISKLKDEFETFRHATSLQAKEAHARAILGVTRLHAAREILIMSSPPPLYFLTFTLFTEVHQGDYAMQEICRHLKKAGAVSTSSASSILRSLSMTHPVRHTMAARGIAEITSRSQAEESSALLGITVKLVRGESQKSSISPLW